MTFARWAQIVERHHRAIIAAAVVLSLLSALALTRLRLDIDVLTMLPRGAPAFDDFKSFVADFGQLDELLVLVEGPPPAMHRFADALAERLARLDTVREVHARVDSARVLDGMLGPFLFNYIPEEAYAQVEERLTPAGVAAAVEADRAILSAPFDLSLARAVAEDPLGLRRIAAQHLALTYEGVAATFDGGYFGSRDGGALLLFVRPTGSPFDAPFAARLAAQVRTAVDEARRTADAGDLRVELAGSYVFAVEDAATMKADIARYTVLSLLGVLAVFYLGYGSLRILPFVAFPLVVTTLLTFALSQLIYDQLNAVSIAFAAILYGLSIDTGIIFYSRLTQERRRHDEARSAIAAVLAGLARAEITGSGTTAAAFLVVGFSLLTAVSQLGVLTALGLLLSVVEFFTLYPALGFVAARRGGGPGRDLDLPWLGRVADAVERHRRPVRVALALAAVVGALLAARVRLDPTLTKLRPGDSRAMRLQEEIAARFAGAGAGGAVLLRRHDLESALIDGERVAAQLRADQAAGAVRAVQSVDAILPSARVQRARLARYNALPRAAAIERLTATLRARGFKPEKFEPFLSAFAPPREAIVGRRDPALAPLAFAIDRHVRQRGDDTIVAVYVDPPAAADWPALAARLRAELPGVDMGIAARALLEAELHQVLRRELRLFIALAVLANLVLLRLLLGDMRTALAVLAPVVVVVLVLFAGMALGGMAIDPVNLVVTPLLLGIGVDYGVYVVVAQRQRGASAAALRSTGRAIGLTALTTIAGFGFLALSTYPPLATMGALVAIGLTLCVAATVLVLPALLPPLHGSAGGSPTPRT